MISAIALALASTALALPTPQEDAYPTISRFGGMSLRSASPIHFGQINANSQQFWIGKDTATYCPDVSVDDCSAYNSNSTVFTYTAGGSTIGLTAVVPGGQYIYVTEGDEAAGQAPGQLRFTIAHSSATVGTPVYEGFSVVQQTNLASLQFEGDDWVACPTDGAYTIYAASRVTADAGSECLGFTWDVLPVADENYVPAWQYTK